jgi:hypothetical protein
MPTQRKASICEEEQFGLTIAVALLLRIEGRMPHRVDVERWARDLEAAIAPIFDVDAETPVGIALRVSERTSKGIAQDLILDAAVACPTYFERAQAERPTRTIAQYETKRSRVTN